VTTSMIPNGLAGLAARLTDSHDKETYGRIIAYATSLPPGDEFGQLVQLLGLLSVLGQRVPDAVAEFLTEVRSQAAASSEYRSQVDQRLAYLPGEISAGVDVAAIAKAMSEAFRQQLAATGLKDTVELLRASAADVTALSGQIAAALKLATRDYQTVSSTITGEVTKLTSTSRELQRQNAQLVAQERSNSWLSLTMMGLLLFVVGMVFGIALEKRQTTDDLANIYGQLGRIQTPNR
jgi:hypothetical protein